MSDQDLAPPAPPQQTKQQHAVVCEAHGLRYNPATHDGCVRCRRERGELPARKAPSRASASKGRSAAPQSAASRANATAMAIAVALMLIVGAGMVLYMGAVSTYDEMQEIRQGAWGDDMTQEQMEELEKELEQIFGPQNDGE